MFDSIPCTDTIILMTARSSEYRAMLESFFSRNRIRFDMIIYNLPPGERILFNDAKPSGLLTAYAVNKQRDAPFKFDFIIDPHL